ncbi:hypothetical protein RHGRI_013158 [Rhododendron griersonianum]|uniref:Uncharacterized protein n=1 Tax=Rhododendron griersonianum TaxID=479676 RepID=A0AAV6K4I6_9ERIC|nr:hypothetical protein RHGRI_013158 [Rhododendron griersonianum]
MKETVQKYIKVVKEGYKRVTQKLGIEFSFSWKAPVLKKRNVLLYVMHGFLVLSWIVQPCKRKEAGAVEKLKDDHAAEGKPAEGGASEADAPGGEIEVSNYDVQWRLYEKTTDASINGVVHWTARKTTSFDDDDGSQLIVSFHLADEVLREICLPKCHCARPNRNCGFISVIYEKPAFTIDRGDEDSYDQQVWEIWLLEDYNNNRES